MWQRMEEQRMASWKNVENKRLFAQVDIPAFSDDRQERKFTKWRADFEDHCTVQKLEDDLSKLSLLKRALKGQALVTLDVLPVEMARSYSRTMAELESRFGPRYDKWRMAHNLITAKHKGTQSVMGFATHMQGLDQDIMSTASDLREYHDILLAACFSDGVRPQFFGKTKPNFSTPF